MSSQGLFRKKIRTEALKNISFQIQQGESVALLGPNGSGKSTTIKCTLGLTKATQGEIRLFEREPSHPMARSVLGYVPQDSDFPEHTTAYDIIQLVASHFDITIDIDAHLKKFHLDKIALQPTHQLSGGQRRLISLCSAFVGNPRLVILDEPTVGLDIHARADFYSYVKNYVSQGGSILLTTHYIEEAEALCPRVILLAKGKIIFDGPAEQIKKRIGYTSIRFKSPSDDFNNTQTDSALPRLSFNDGYYNLITKDADTWIRNHLLKNEFTDLEVKSINLDEALIEALRDHANVNKNAKIGDAL